jgi:hypothetical protein
MLSKAPEITMLDWVRTLVGETGEPIASKELGVNVAGDGFFLATLSIIYNRVKKIGSSVLRQHHVGYHKSEWDPLWNIWADMIDAQGRSAD